MTERYGYRLPTDLEMEQRAEIDRLRAENAKLREALALIEGAYFKNSVTLAVDGKWQEVTTELQKIARAALKDTQP